MENAEVVDRAVKRAKDTWIFEHPDGHAIVLAHPGQPEPNRDPKFLRDNFGIMPAHSHLIKRLSESERHRPLTDAEKALERAADLDARIAEVEQELEALKERKAGLDVKASGARASKAGPDPAEK